MKKLFPFVSSSIFVSQGYSQEKPKYLQTNSPVQERLSDLINQLTNDEKNDMLAGYNDFYFHPVEHLGIPPFIMADGP